MLRALLQTYRVNSINNIRDGRVPPPSRVQAVSSGWHAGPRVDSGACLVQPAPGRCPIRRQHGVEQANRRRKRRWTARLAGGGRAVRQCVWQRASRCCASKSMSAGFPKGSAEARGRSDWVSSLNGRGSPLAVLLQVLPKTCNCWCCPRRDTHCFSFAVCLSSLLETKSPVVVVNPGKKENLSATHIAADGLITTTTTLEKRGASR